MGKAMQRPFRGGMLLHCIVSGYTFRPLRYLFGEIP